MENSINSTDIFNLDPGSFVTPAKASGEIYQPQADKGRDGVYKALIRFLPNPRNVMKSKIKKSYVWIEDPVTSESFSVDCPSTVGKKSILADTYWKLKKSTSARDNELAEKFSRNESHYSLVQIVKDPNAPDLEGKIMVFKFGIKINQKIEALLKPEFGEPVNPYDLFNGKLFALNITKKQKWNNYDLCEFVGDKTPLILEGKPIQKTQEDMTKVTAWLKDNSPELEKYDYKEWTGDTEEKVKRAIRNIIPDGRTVEAIVGGLTASTPSAAAPSTTFDTFAAPQAQEAAPAKAPVSSLDDLYNGL